MEMYRLKVGDELAELAQVVEYDLAAPVRHSLLSDTGLLQEVEKDALNGVLAPAPLVRVREGRFRRRCTLDRRSQGIGLNPDVCGVPCLLDRRFVHSLTAPNEVEELMGRLGLEGPE
jgi:hypothetical protein